jgi:hypothetical protein
MSYTESKTFTNIPLPKHIDPCLKLKDFTDSVVEKSLREWFSGNHFLDGYAAWDYLMEDTLSESAKCFADENTAKANLESAIRRCVTSRKDCNESYFQVYRDSNSFGDEVHDWIVREFLLDAELSLSSVLTCYFVSDSREGCSVGALRVSLSESGDLIANSLI